MQGVSGIIIEGGPEHVAHGVSGIVKAQVENALYLLLFLDQEFSGQDRDRAKRHAQAPRSRRNPDQARRSGKRTVKSGKLRVHHLLVLDIGDHRIDTAGLQHGIGQQPDQERAGVIDLDDRSLKNCAACDVAELSTKTTGGKDS